jgi:Spy/CpxP family protein refolding chaperone
MIKLKILALLCSLFLLNSLYAEDYKLNNHEYKKDHIHKNLDYLNLDKKQLEKIKDILIKYRKKYDKYSKKKTLKEQKLKELIKQENFDKEEYEEILEDIYEDAAELEAKVIKRIHSVLTVEQRKKFSYYLKEWRVE